MPEMKESKHGKEYMERSVQKEHTEHKEHGTQKEHGEHKKHTEHAEGKESKSLKYAHEIKSPKEHEGHHGESLVTKNHEVIRHWAEERKAVPATVPGTEHGGRPGVLRFNFPGFGGQNLQEISWDDWFGTFDSRELNFIYQETTTDGKQSNFFHLESPHREHD